MQNFIVIIYDCLNEKSLSVGITLNLYKVNHENNFF